MRILRSWLARRFIKMAMVICVQGFCYDNLVQAYMHEGEPW